MGVVGSCIGRRRSGPIGMVQFVSDLHLEFKDGSADNFVAELQRILPPRAPYLVMAGDISWADRDVLRRLLTYLNSNFEAVFAVPGNHEYFYYREEMSVDELRQRKSVPKEVLTMNQIDSILRSIYDEFDRCYFLNCDMIDDPRFPFAVIGATLWSEISAQQADAVTHYCRNHTFIFTDGESGAEFFSIDEHNKLFHKHRDYIDNCLKSLPPTRKRIVITHHVPLRSLINPDMLCSTHSMFCSSYFSDLPDIVAKADCWAFGHTHETITNKFHQQTKLCANCVGYEHERSLYVPGLVVAI